jgi:hypothetical protein
MWTEKAIISMQSIGDMQNALACRSKNIKPAYNLKRLKHISFSNRFPFNTGTNK